MHCWQKKAGTLPCCSLTTLPDALASGAHMSFQVPSVTYPRVNSSGDVIQVTRKPFTRRTIKADVWKYHLRQMAASEDPIDYLCRFLPAADQLARQAQESGETKPVRGADRSHRAAAWRLGWCFGPDSRPRGRSDSRLCLKLFSCSSFYLGSLIFCARIHFSVPRMSTAFGFPCRSAASLLRAIHPTGFGAVGWTH